MGLFEALEEKKFDVRVLDRLKSTGKLESKTQEQAVKNLKDDAEAGMFVNVDEINAKDNPVHVPRGLPAHDGPQRKNIEDMEFDADESNRAFEH